MPRLGLDLGMLETGWEFTRPRCTSDEAINGLILQ
jgi:hypothetical protein